jgi:ABC-type phosphate transport system auxiliary subunit
MVETLGNRDHGRPPRPIDPEKAALQRRTQELQAKLDVLQQTERIRQLLTQPEKKNS